jgi:hypothetical protein
VRRIRSLFLSRAVRATLAGAAAVAVLAVVSPAAEKRLSDREVANWVARRVKDWQPSADDRPFDRIGWVKDIREAERLAKKHRRPVFLFTHDGHIATGRC